LRAQPGQGRLARVVEQRGSLNQPLFQRHAVSPKVAVSFEGVGECSKVRIHGGSRELHRNAFPLLRAVCVRCAPQQPLAIAERQSTIARHAPGATRFPVARGVDTNVNLIPLHAGNPGPMTGRGNWTYLIPGSAPVLIDAGVGEAPHLDALFAHVPSGPAQVLVTHIHPDHASGAPAVAQRAPAATFLKFPWPARDAEIPVPWQPLADGDVVDTGEGPLQVVHTPGHAPDHVILWHETSGTAFTGDLLVLGNTVVIPARTSIWK